MSKKNKSDNNGFVFSTDPNFKFESDQEEQKTLVPASQQLRIKLDTKNRGGKAVTLIEGFVGTDSDLQELGKKLKNFCGTGGSAKAREIIIQGDQRVKVLQWFKSNGYLKAK